MIKVIAAPINPPAICTIEYRMNLVKLIFCETNSSKLIAGLIWAPLVRKPSCTQTITVKPQANGVNAPSLSSPVARSPTAHKLVPIN